ncbi:hypothetical protein [Streptomyces chartreusis]
MHWFQGAYRITVVTAQAAWPQRAIITMRGGKTVLIPGVIGASETIDTPAWGLELEHYYQGCWHPNVRAVIGKCQTTETGRSWTIRSRDRESSSGGTERSLVLRLDQAEGPAPALQPYTGSAVLGTCVGVPAPPASVPPAAVAPVAEAVHTHHGDLFQMPASAVGTGGNGAGKTTAHDSAAEAEVSPPSSTATYGG